MVDVSLYDGDTPYVSIMSQLHMFVPFRHTLALYTKSDSCDHWTFDDIDTDEFPLDERRIRDWEWILVLDKDYGHGTMITCCYETIHGNRLSIRSGKNYRNARASIDLDVSIDISEEAARQLHADVVQMVEMVRARWTQHVRNENDVVVIPRGRVCQYTMNGVIYRHNIL